MGPNGTHLHRDISEYNVLHTPRHSDEAQRAQDNYVDPNGGPRPVFIREVLDPLCPKDQYVARAHIQLTAVRLLTLTD